MNTVMHVWHAASAHLMVPVLILFAGFAYYAVAMWECDRADRKAADPVRAARKAARKVMKLEQFGTEGWL